ncbi:MAG: P-loop NTPase [Clostridia bacterium]|nr:P-loop NTPase [Clostridia bacterium]
MENKLFRFDEISIPSAIRVVLKNLWVILLLCVSVFLIVTSVMKLRYVPRFTSTTTLMVGARDSTNAYNSLTTTQSMASVFMEVFQSNVLRDKVSEKMNGEPFDGSVSTSVIPETNLLIVSVTSSSPDKAFRQLQLVLDNYESISDYLFENAQLEVIRDPNVPVAPSNPLNMQRASMILVGLTAVGSTALILFLWIFRDTVQTPKAARRKLDARVLRTIRHEVKNKTRRLKMRGKNVAPLIKNPLISLDFLEDNLSLSSTVEYHMRRRRQQVILVTSVGENEGKSTVAANLAIALGEKGRRVLLLDCDFRKPSQHKIFEMRDRDDQIFSSYVLSGEDDPAKHLVFSEKYGITLGLSRADHKSISRLINSGSLDAFLKRMRGEMDYIILDTPPMLAAADAETLARLADTALLVVRSDFMPTSSVNQGLDRLRKAAPELCGIVLNNHREKVFYL